jgi:membrane protease YdiL (CAAX protease family)
MWGIIVFANQFGYLKYGTPASLILFFIGGNAPPLVAYVILKRGKKIRGFKQYVKEAFAVKQKPLYYILVIAFLALYYGIPALMGGITLQAKLYVGIISIFPMIFLGGLEELGWRYILQPALEERFSFAIATSITSLIWSVWHFPIFFIEGTSQYNWSFGIFTIMVFGLSFALASVRYISKSIWLCILLHSTVNAMMSSWFVKDSITIKSLTALVMIVVSYAMVMYHKNKVGVQKVTTSI